MSIHYRDGTVIPHPRDRCSDPLIEYRQIGKSTYTHFCREEQRHEGKHQCICGKNWENYTRNQNKETANG